MYEQIVAGGVVVFYAYLALGLVFASWFVSRGIKELDEQTAGASIWFRLIIIPGALALWPWLLRRWLCGLAQGQSRSTR
jgi:hypothetical protein